jgi:hypothetical protein
MQENFDAEEWRPIEGWPHYEVSSLGRIKRMIGKNRSVARVYTPKISKRKIFSTHLSHAGRRASVDVHILVATAFIGTKPDGGHKVVFVDGNRNNLRVENLAWRSGSKRPAPCHTAHIDGEIWLPVVGYPSYEVSDFGRVRNKANGRFLRLAKLKHGHLKCALGRRNTQYVHRIVLLAFRGPPDDPSKIHCAHYDGDPSNNKLSNLRWATAAENAADDRRNGVARGGASHQKYRERHAGA